MNPERVTGRFVHAYYTLFVGRPLRDQEKGITLTRLYSESATFSVAQTSQGGQKKVKGASDIMAHIEELRQRFQFNHATVYSIDYQPMASTLLISVVGELRCTEHSIPFTQTFILTKSQSSSEFMFYIATDMLRLHPSNLVLASYPEPTEKQDEDTEESAVDIKFKFTPPVIAKPTQTVEKEKIVQQTQQKQQEPPPQQSQHRPQRQQQRGQQQRQNEVKPAVHDTEREEREEREEQAELAPEAFTAEKSETASKWVSLFKPGTPATQASATTPATATTSTQTKRQQTQEKPAVTSTAAVGTSLFVAGFPAQQAYPPVKTYFTQLGAVSVRLRSTFAFVEFETVAQAQIVLNNAATKPYVFEGHQLRVDVAKDDGRKANTLTGGNPRNKK